MLSTVIPATPQGSTDPSAQATSVGKGLGDDNFAATDTARNQASYVLTMRGVT